MKHEPKETLFVTDHAVLRYLERVQGQPIEQVREHIRQLCAGAAALQATSVRAEGVRFEIVNDRVTTVTPDRVLPSKIGRQNAQARMRR